jgi:hypothetical protein
VRSFVIWMATKLKSSVSQDRVLNNRENHTFQVSIILLNTIYFDNTRNIVVIL